MLKIDAQAFDEYMMRHCFALAAKAAAQGEYPYAAVVVRDGEIVAETTNKVAQDRDVTRHAETVAISEAQKTARQHRSVRLHHLRQHGALRVLLLRDPREPDRQGGLFHALADHGRRVALEHLG